jgi:RHS repeat-associated protein
MTTAAICATREVSWGSSFYRGEQYDSDLGLYYLRARYYNPNAGRFLSRDPEDGNKIIPISLHKYLYAGSNPVNKVDPRGRDMFEYAMESNAAVSEARLLSIYGCVADAALAAVDLILDEHPGYSNALGGVSAVLGCVVLTPGLSELAEAGNRIVKSAEWARDATGWGACALDADNFLNALNGVLSGSPNEDAIGKSIESLGGCVGDLLGEILKEEL